MQKGDVVFVSDSGSEAKVVVSNVMASSGNVVHVIDAVLLPAGPTELPSIGELLTAGLEDGTSFKTLVAALNASKLLDPVAGGSNQTILAPTDRAFAALPDGTVEGLLADVDSLTAVLKLHVAGSVVLTEDLKDGDEVTMLMGTLRVKVTSQGDVVEIPRRACEAL